ncbi:hypothetical protein [Thalassobaculum sp.]|uniref:hypothetical protein n=1 Tax=Thalassobaculum sp. TaxID=2022740 RepID=UPI0032ED1F1C
MAHRRPLIAAVIGALALVGCSTGSAVKSGGSSAAHSGPAPAPAPLYAPGDAFVYDDGGTVTREQVVSVSPDRVVWTNDSGLIWTKDTAVVTPPLMWSDDPELGRGRQTIIGSPNQLFPLQEGNVIAYSVRGSSENAPAGWQDEHRCVVAGHEAVEVKAGRFDAFRVDCQRKDYRDTYYYAPTVQNYVLRLRQFANRQNRKELVSVSLANDRANAAAPIAAPAAPVETTPIGAPAHPVPMVGDDGKMMGEPGMHGAGDPMMEKTLVTRLEAVVTRLEKLAGMEAGGAMPAKGAAAKPAAAATGGNWAVHLASYRSQKGATDGWKTLQRQFPQLKGMTMRTSEFDSGKGRGTYVRLLAVGFPSEAAAKEFCQPMVSKRQFCEAKGPLP